MNWTGGGLQRHSATNSKSIAAQRQKQHFARAQQNLRTSGIVHKNSPVKFSVFGIDVRDRERLDQKIPSTQHSSSFNGDNRSQRSQAGLKPTAHLPPPEIRATPRDRSHEHESHRHQRPHIKRDPSQVPEDDLYNVTPPPRPVKRKRDDLGSDSDVVSVSQGRGVKESLSEIKKRLLRRGDWVGVTVQKPLELAFSSVKDANDIGRRRMVSEGQKAKYRSVQPHIVSPFTTKSRLLKNQSGNMRLPPRTHPSSPDVRISIGGRTVPPGVSSSVAQRRETSACGKKSSRAVSSEVLLLDNESFRGLYTKDDSRAPTERSEQTSLLLKSSSRATSQHRFDGASQRSHSQHAHAGNDNSSQHELATRDPGWAGVTASSLAKLQRNFQKLPSSIDNRSSRPHKKIAPAADLRQKLRSGREVFSSSSASMRYPRPQSSRRSILIRGDSSQFAESNKAQLGNQEPTLSSSQLLQNQIWQKWVAPPSQDEEDNDGLRDTANESQAASPGLSVTPPARLPSIFPGEEIYSSDLEEPLFDQLQEGHDDISGVFNGDDAASDQVEEKDDCANKSESMEDLHTETHSPFNEVYGEKGTPSDSEEDTLDGTNKAISSHEINRPIKSQRLELPPMKAQASSQLADDEVWRKFVFGSSDKPESFNSSAAEQVDSIVVHPSSRQDTDTVFRSLSPLQSLLAEMSQLVDDDLDDDSHATNSHHSYGPTHPSQQYNSSPGDGRTSVHVADGSVLPSSSELAPTTMAVHAKSLSTGSYISYSEPSRPQRKFVFGKPNPFIGRNSRLDATSDEEPFSIGRGPRGNDEEEVARSRRKRGAISSNFADTDEADELESIEDD